MNKAALKRDPAARKHALRRLMHDYEECLANPLPAVTARPVSDKDFFRWHGNITGPPGSALAGCFFHVELEFADTYPRDSPKVRLLTDLNHTFVFKKYKYICINMLENEWDMNHIDVSDRGQMYTGWSSAYTVQAILVQLQAFLFDRRNLCCQACVDQSRRWAAAYVCTECDHTAQWPSPRPTLDFSECGSENKEEEEEKEDVEEKESAGGEVEEKEIAEKRVDEINREEKGKERAVENTVEEDVDMKDVDASEDADASAASDDVLATVFGFLDPASLRAVRDADGRFDRIVRRRVDRENIRAELRCFFSKASYRDEVLGVGLSLSCHPRGNRAIKDIDPTLDLLGWTAYHELEQRKGVWKEEFTHFLPIYITSSHGDRSLPRAVEVMRDMCASEAGVKTDVDAVLSIIPKMLNTMVVNTMKGDLHESVRALQGYCYFNHLFLALCERKPEIRAEADRRIGEFLSQPHKRTKASCPALGEWITLLLVSDRFSWDDVCDVYLQENFDRNVRWIVKGCPSYCEASTGAYFRRQLSLKYTEVSRKLALFHVMFLQMLRGGSSAATGGKKRRSTADTRALLDATFGRPSGDMEKAVQRRVKAIKGGDAIFFGASIAVWAAFFEGVGRPALSDEELDRWLVTAMHNSREKRYHRSPLLVGEYPPKPGQPMPGQPTDGRPMPRRPNFGRPMPQQRIPNRYANRLQPHGHQAAGQRIGSFLAQRGRRNTWRAQHQQGMPARNPALRAPQNQQSMWRAPGTLQENPAPLAPQNQHGTWQFPHPPTRNAVPQSQQGTWQLPNPPARNVTPQSHQGAWQLPGTPTGNGAPLPNQNQRNAWRAPSVYVPHGQRFGNCNNAPAQHQVAPWAHQPPPPQPAYQPRPAHQNGSPSHFVQQQQAGAWNPNRYHHQGPAMGNGVRPSQSNNVPVPDPQHTHAWYGPQFGHQHGGSGVRNTFGPAQPQQFPWAQYRTHQQNTPQYHNHPGQYHNRASHKRVRGGLGGNASAQKRARFY